MKSTVNPIHWVPLTVGEPYIGSIIWAQGVAEECRGEGIFLTKFTRRGYKILSSEEWSGVMHKVYSWAPFEMPHDPVEEGDPHG